ncbi:chemotaxis protein CheD [Halegenticoccus tardaugens]|uniref:chemotaxis protein CheD n=1 Tax=Halegenticoccus tardaugens TaxID=2071624 RepID=UPI00100A3535|nr:chemotaxis protein CheD [Halegenticoccus tardaugens]
MVGSARDPDDPRRIRVGVSEYAVAEGDALLTTSGLGSCLGVALHDADAEVAGLLHAMLPTAGASDSLPAKYVDAGIARTLGAMEERGAHPRRIAAKLAGGSEMLDLSVAESVGARNVETAREVLGDAGVPIRAADVGGGHGRSIQFDATTGALVIKTAHRGERTV